MTLPAHAQRKNISGMEKGVLAFYKISGLKPNFDKWAKISLNPKQHNMNIPDDLIEQEKLRLQYGLGTYNPDREILEIQTTILSEVITQNNKKYLASHFPGKSALAAPYFPYQAGYTMVAVVMNDLEKYMLLKLDDTLYQKIKLLMPETGQESELHLDLHFRPVDADQEPIQLDGYDQHIMLAEIAHIAFHKPALAGQRESVLLWEYYAPWYLSRDEQTLLNILEDR
tara:strand:- start:283 stop:963 length:681 start_codon:yes stop_codon:yes gene_type:complete